MARSRLATYCPYCASVVPAGKVCRCRRSSVKHERKPTPGDATRSEREPWRARYSGAEYKRARQEAIGRQQGRCCDCGRVCAEWDGAKWRTARLGGEVDHVVPLCEGGTDEPSNLRLRCKSCHGKEEAKRREARRKRASGGIPSEKGKAPTTPQAALNFDRFYGIGETGNS